jgi:hypothetical protein
MGSAMIATGGQMKIVTIMILGLLALAGCGVSASTKTVTSAGADPTTLPSQTTVTESITITETVTESATVHPIRIDAACGSSVVHYGELPVSARLGGIPATPWIAGAGTEIIGALFYYGLPPFDARPAKAVIGTGGRAGAGVSTKILWWTRSDAAELSITGHRLDGPGSFAVHVPSAQGGGTVGTQFPSVIEIPHPGCWRVDLESGRSAGSVTVQAYDVMG